MANTYHQIYLHVVFAVKYRTARIDKEWRPTLLGVIGNLVNEANGKTIIVNGVEDHVHCLLKPAVSISDLMKGVKAKSSKYINDHSLTSTRFESAFALATADEKGRSIPRSLLRNLSSELALRFNQFIGRKATVYSHMDSHRSTAFITILRIRKYTIEYIPSRMIIFPS